MQASTAAGLRPAESAQRRCTAVPTLNASAEHATHLLQMWAHKTPQQAYDVLQLPDVTVTNQGDKSTQLQKLLGFSGEVVHAFTPPLPASEPFCSTKDEEQSGTNAVEPTTYLSLARSSSLLA